MCLHSAQQPPKLLQFRRFLLVIILTGQPGLPTLLLLPVPARLRLTPVGAAISLLLRRCSAANRRLLPVCSHRRPGTAWSASMGAAAGSRARCSDAQHSREDDVILRC